jgi:hypothetical protein
MVTRRVKMGGRAECTTGLHHQSICWRDRNASSVVHTRASRSVSAVHVAKSVCLWANCHVGRRDGPMCDTLTIRNWLSFHNHEAGIAWTVPRRRLGCTAAQGWTTGLQQQRYSGSELSEQVASSVWWSTDCTFDIRAPFGVPAISIVLCCLQGRPARCLSRDGCTPPRMNNTLPAVGWPSVPCTMQVSCSTMGLRALAWHIAPCMSCVVCLCGVPGSIILRQGMLHTFQADAEWHGAPSRWRPRWRQPLTIARRITPLYRKSTTNPQERRL